MRTQPAHQLLGRGAACKRGQEAAQHRMHLPAAAKADGIAPPPQRRPAETGPPQGSSFQLKRGPLVDPHQPRAGSGCNWGCPQPGREGAGGAPSRGNRGAAPRPAASHSSYMGTSVVPPEPGSASKRQGCPLPWQAVKPRSLEGETFWEPPPPAYETGLACSQEVSSRRAPRLLVPTLQRWLGLKPTAGLKLPQCGFH